MLREGKSAKFRATAIADGHKGYAAVQKPINQGHGWQTEPIGHRDKNNAEQHDRTTQGLIKIFI